MNIYLGAAQRLHHYLYENWWDGDKLLGPDSAVRFNRRIWRFVKSYLSFVPWTDNYYYLQGQGYWVLSNWKMYDLVGDQRAADMAIECSNGILESQHSAGNWDYPYPGWGGRTATVESIFAGIGMLASYENTRYPEFLDGAVKAYKFLVDRVGFQEAESGYAINYFADVHRGLVPNNTTLALLFFGWLAKITGDQSYLRHCVEMVAFLVSAQLETGELPYAIKSSLGKGHLHFQCYQYNSFELLDLAMYYQVTNDTTVLPVIAQIAKFLSASVNADGSAKFDCRSGDTQIVYHTAAVAAALCMARRLDLHHALQEEERAYGYVLAHQDRNGGFPFSTREHRFLKDKRYYPRPQAMILYHLLLKAAEPTSLDRGSV